MTKKFREIDEVEAFNFCLGKECKECPLHVGLMSCLRDFVYHHDLLSNKVLEMEIELDETN